MSQSVRDFFVYVVMTYQLLGRKTGGKRERNGSTCHAPTLAKPRMPCNLSDFSFYLLTLYLGEMVVEVADSQRALPDAPAAHNAHS